MASAANCYAPVESDDSGDGDYHYSPGESNRGPAMEKSAGDAATKEAARTAVVLRRRGRSALLSRQGPVHGTAAGERGALLQSILRRILQLWFLTIVFVLTNNV